MIDLFITPPPPGCRGNCAECPTPDLATPHHIVLEDTVPYLTTYNSSSVNCEHHGERKGAVNVVGDVWLEVPGKPEIMAKVVSVEVRAWSMYVRDGERFDAEFLITCEMFNNTTPGSGEELEEEKDIIFTTLFTVGTEECEEISYYLDMLNSVEGDTLQVDIGVFIPTVEVSTYEDCCYDYRVVNTGKIYTLLERQFEVIRALTGVTTTPSVTVAGDIPLTLYTTEQQQEENSVEQDSTDPIEKDEEERHADHDHEEDMEEMNGISCAKAAVLLFMTCMIAFELVN
eukprot:sb/3467745/